MGLGGVLVALAAGLVALLPLPAFLYWLGPRIDALAPRRLQQVPVRRPLGRLAAWVMRRPGRVAALSASFLIVLALPAFSVHFVGVDATTLPPRRARGRWQRRSSARTSAAATRRSPRSRRAGRRRPRRRGSPRRRERAALLPPRQVAPGLWRLDLLPREKALSESAQQPRPHGAGGAARSATGHRADRGLRRPTGIARGAPPVGARDPRADDLRRSSSSSPAPSCCRSSRSS